MINTSKGIPGCYGFSVPKIILQIVKLKDTLVKIPHRISLSYKPKKTKLSKTSKEKINFIRLPSYLTIVVAK